jgi:hypothetical protein
MDLPTTRSALIRFWRMRNLSAVNQTMGDCVEDDLCASVHSLLEIVRMLRRDLGRSDENRFNRPERTIEIKT